MNSAFHLILLGIALTSTAGNAVASDLDPFNTGRTVAALPSKAMLDLEEIQEPCHFKEIIAPLDLLEVVERALCNHPQTREAWANVKVQAAQVGLMQAAYLPTANITANVTRGPVTNLETRYPQYSYDGRPTTSRNWVFNMGWILFDFGSRRANLENARYLLAAANSIQDETLQTVFADTAQAFYNLLSEQGMEKASEEAEKFAQQNFLATDDKYKVGVGNLADMLQAQTSYAQATLDRVKAEGTLRNAQGALAAAIGMPPNTTFTLDAGQSALPDTGFVSSVDTLISEAELKHPRLIAAKAQLQAAQASVDVAKAAGMPSIGLIANINDNYQSNQLPSGVHLPSSDYRSLRKSIGIQISIPIFEGLSRSYYIQSAKAKVEVSAENLADTENQVSLSIWTNYQSLATETENLKSTDALLQSATQSANVAQGRYKSGVGTIIELLSAQSALASARQQRIQALSNWRIARLELAASLGKLGLWAIQ